MHKITSAALKSIEGAFGLPVGTLAVLENEL